MAATTPTPAPTPPTPPGRRLDAFEMALYRQQILQMATAFGRLKDLVPDWLNPCHRNDGGAWTASVWEQCLNVVHAANGLRMQGICPVETCRLHNLDGLFWAAVNWINPRYDGHHGDSMDWLVREVNALIARTAKPTP
jgi:hypothetical protein